MEFIYLTNALCSFSFLHKPRRRINHKMNNNETLQIKAVIFDMDGVLLDSESVCDKTFLQAAKEQNIQDTKPIIDDARGMGKNSFIDFISKIYGDSVDAEKLWNRASELFHEIEETKGLSLLPYAKEILEYLKPNYKIALATSTKRASAQRQMENAGVFNFFDVTIFGDEVSSTKPSPVIYQTACQKLNLLPENCLAIEDSYNGIKSAYDAGIKVIMVPDQVKPNDILESMCWKICNSLKELKEFL